MTRGLPPYEHRAKNLGLASKEEVKEAASDPEAVWVDVRSEGEVAESSLKNQEFVHHSCTVDSCEGLEEKAKQYLKDKNAPVIIFCRSGRRATKAKEILEKEGYTRVLNAGGLADIEYLHHP